MIPVKLALRNFMPYRDNVPPLHFTGLRTVSIWGDNGNGKSALIDAMTWALWGQTRAKSDDDLIHAGQPEMEVEFEFTVGQQTYRAIRKHSRPKRQGASGQSSLDLQIAADGSFRSISGNSIRETEQKIIDLLHMKYDTFINSAYLRQGHADEFTQQPPSKRKEVLASILELSRYDGLEKQARELAKEKENKKALAESEIENISGELARQPAYQAELTQAQTEMETVETAIREQESRLNELRQKTALLKDKQAQLSLLEGHIAETTRALAHWADQIKQRHSRIEEYEELIARRAAIEEGYARLSEARKLDEELNHKLRRVNTLNEHKHQLEIAIVQASQVLLKEHALVESKIGELEASFQKLPQLKDKLRQVQAKLGQLASEETTLQQKKQAIQGLRNHIHTLESDKARLLQEITDIAGKLDLLSGQTEAKCPLCGSELGADGLKHIEAEYAAQKQQKAGSLKSIQSELAKKETELKSTESEASRLELRLNQSKSSAQNKAALLDREIEEAEKASGQLAEVKNRLAEIEERLARKDFAAGQQAALGQLEDELTMLAYDARQHEQLRQRLDDLEQHEAPKRKLDEADKLISQGREELSRAEQASHELGRSLESDKQKRQKLSMELGSLPLLVNDLERLETEHRALSARQKQTQETVGRIKEKLQRCAELEVKKQEKEGEFKKLAEEETIYRELAQAFGKNGIQAWLIEMALPEIEAEADRLLGRMTDNRMHVKIESQRPTKKGEPVETLDIKIADELGTRNYEMFSGGEAFRIDFAIRIALSRLLARRAGAPLPTLIIDEGFGTQDSNGIEKLKEAITSIQDDFDKIIVITHVEELRDAFPNRIDVVKTAEGSTFEVS